MRPLVIFLCFLQLNLLCSQKVVQKAFIDPEIESIQISANKCYQLDVETNTGNEILVSANIEGEYADDLLVTLSESGKTLLVNAAFNPNFEAPNDKLSAHKVVSIALDIKLPAYKQVYVYGTNCNVHVTGDYRYLNVKLSSGRCTLHNVSEDVTVRTQKGDIFLATPAGNVIAKSSYGKIRGEQIPRGNNRFILNTIQGNIHLSKTK